MGKTKSERIKIEHVRRQYAVEGISLVNLDEVEQTILAGRPYNEHGVYTPEVVVVVHNTESLYIGIYVAHGADGNYYTHYNVAYPTGGCDGWPSRSNRKSKALMSALRQELEWITKIRCHQEDQQNKMIWRISEEAIRKINSKQVRQLTIFDML